MRVTTLCAGLVVAVQLSAQFPIGHSTPVNGYAPALFAEPLWIGNPGFGYRIQHAPPGGSALVAISPGRMDQVISGLQIYLDVGDLVITHTAAIDATGRATISFPLGSPDDLGLMGLQFYAQAAVTNPAVPGALGATEAVLLEITLHPMLAFSAWGGVLFLLDPVAGTAVSVPGILSLINDLVFANGGRDLFVGSYTGLFLVDTLTAAPTPVSLLPTQTTSLAWDRVHRRLYALDSQTIKVIDGNRASAAFGNVIAQAPIAGQSSIAISADGNVLASVAMTGLTRFDSDPASATYLSVVPTPTAPFVGAVVGTWVGRLQVSPDGRIASAAVTTPVPALQTAIHRFDSLTGTWLDHDPMTPGYQPLSATNHPALPATFELRSTRDGSGMVVRGATALSRFDLDLAAPTSFNHVSTSTLPPGNENFYTTLTPSGQFLVRHTHQTALNPTPVFVSFIQTSTGWITPWVELPAFLGFTPAPIAAWR